MASSSDPPHLSRLTSSSAPASASIEGLRFGIVGAGRLGATLAVSFRRAGADLVGFVCATLAGSARAEAVLGTPATPDVETLLAAGPDLVILAVPDDRLPAVARQVAALLAAEARSGRGARRVAVMHTSGATSLQVLDGCAAAGATVLAFHPLQTFADPLTGPERLAASAVAITTQTEAGRLLGRRLALAVGARPFALADHERVLYHAAACLASNYLVTLVDVAADLFHRAGLPPDAGLDAFMPLVQGTVDNLLAGGDAALALTGPLSRGDVATIQAHIDALHGLPEVRALYCALGLRTLDVVRRQHRLDDHVLAQLEHVLIQQHRTEPMEEAPMNPLSSTLQRQGTVQVLTRDLEFSTQGDGDIINVTARLRELLTETGLDAGTATVFAPGATGAVTTLEFETGVVHDFQRLFDEISAPDRPYDHNVRLGDGNGHSHVRAGLLGPSLVVPFVDGRFTLGTWQEVCFVCFDNRPRERRLVVQFMGV